MRLGFSAFGCAPAMSVDEWRRQQWESYLSEGRQADMAYLQNHLEKRLNPTLLVEGAKTVVSLAMNYYPGSDWEFGSYAFAKYAVGRDYHEVMKEKLEQLLQFIRTTADVAVEGRAFCDTAPVDEHYWAWKCGLGWLGRNTQLTIPKQGSYFFLGELVLNATFDHYDTPMSSKCGSCHRCIDVCPMHALSEANGLDARRCLSYLTIEHRGDFPKEIGLPQLGNCIYGCDRCIAVCPHNRFATLTHKSDFLPRSPLLEMQREDWHALTQEEFSKIFKGSAVKRAKHAGLMRNIEVAKQSETADL